ncbi:cytochrome b/b6 domain-containing protein [Aliiglaciecola sp. CAU 1673]|uniref:cytochrome b/b6 domain-containing protein n=1 Tax=Aliiglaciecola sp. CAU 1673 TaxID=3032595 RepID=UPI0023DCD0BF|nr:cytochrome b/b6 domain-containing protein [Aliiglaciecola sp. CAU 1673]MDF2177369.1 cytochrome b/b6 domain-containing protein [Aliiglaciecola sp. CAU 1673]
MTSKTYIIDRTLHWFSALLLLFMLMSLSSQLHNVDWDMKGQLEHRQEAVEIHALIGMVLVLLTLLRIVLPYLTKTKTKTEIPRVKPKSTKHAWFIKITHLALYVCIFGLVATGLMMFNNYEIRLSLFGMAFEPSRDNFYQVFPGFHDLHMQHRDAIWWLIGIHFVGIMVAKR